MSVAKHVIISGVFLLVCSVTSLSFALPMDSLVADFDITDTFTNPDDLANASQKTELRWLRELLGNPLDAELPTVAKKEGVDFVRITQDILGEDRQYLELDPGFVWTYAAVRFGGKKSILEYFALQDTSDDDVLVFDFTGIYPSKNGISHVTFFRAPDHPTPVPEPATLLLFGAGIIGLFGILRSRRRKNS